MTYQPTDADLIRKVKSWASVVKDMGIAAAVNDLHRAAARIEELTQPAPQRVVDKSELKRLVCQVFGEDFQIVREQPAPLALSAEDAAMWNAKVNAAKHLSAIYGADSLIGLERVVLAVDDLLRQRIEPQPLALSKEDAQAWDVYIDELRRYNSSLTETERAILAVDALLKQRMTPLSGEDLRNIARTFKGNTQQRFRDHWDEIVELIREVESAHGIGGAK